MKRFITLLTVFVLIIGVISGCAVESQDSNQVVTPEEDRNPYEDMKVGMVVSTLLNPFFVDLKDGAVEQAEAYSIDLIVLDSRDNANREKENIQFLIEEGVDAIVLNAVDVESSIEIINTADQEGISVITIDRVVNSDKVSMHIASDNFTGGKLAGNYIAEQLGGKGRIVEILGLSGASVDKERGDGFKSILDETDIELIAEPRADFDRERGMAVMMEILDEFDEIDAVFAHNDEMALGALKAIKLKERDIIVVGFDGSDDAVVAVQDGSMAATIAQQPVDLGREGIRAVVRFLANETSVKEIRVPLKLITSLTEEK